MYSVYKSALSHYILKMVQGQDIEGYGSNPKYEIEWKEVPYITKNKQMIYLEKYFHSRWFIQSCRLFGMKCESYGGSSPYSVIKYEEKIINFPKYVWKRYKFGSLCLFEGNSKDEIKRSLLLLLIDPLQFIDRKRNEIGGSSVRMFFKEYERKINKLLKIHDMKFMLFAELVSVGILVRDVMERVVSIWANIEWNFATQCLYKRW